MAVNNTGEIAGSVGGGGVEFSCIGIAQDAIKKEICITKRFVSKGDGDEWKADDADTSLGVCGGSLTVFYRTDSRRARDRDLWRGPCRTAPWKTL